MGVSIVRDGKFIFCGVASLKKKVPINDEVERFAEYLHQRFGRFAVVSIERQRAGNMRRIELYIEKAFEKYSRATIIVAPQCVKRYYNYSGLKSYADRKRVGTEKFMALCRETGQYDSIFRKAASEPIPRLYGTSTGRRGELRHRALHVARWGAPKGEGRKGLGAPLGPEDQIDPATDCPDNASRRHLECPSRGGAAKARKHMGNHPDHKAPCPLLRRLQEEADRPLLPLPLPLPRLREAVAREMPWREKVLRLLEHQEGVKNCAQGRRRKIIK